MLPKHPAGNNYYMSRDRRWLLAKHDDFLVNPNYFIYKRYSNKNKYSSTATCYLYIYDK